MMMMMEDQRHGEGETEHCSKKPFFSSFSPFLSLLVLLPSLVLVLLVCKLDLEIPWRIGFDKDLSSLQNSQLNSFSNNISSPKLVETADLDLKGQSFPPSIEESQKTVAKDKEANGKSATSGISKTKGYSKLKKLEEKLGRARAAIRKASQLHNLTSIHHDPDYVPTGPIYRNPNAFHRSYLEMERLLKIYVYKEGEPPMFHGGPCKSIYSTEGRFIHEMEKGNLYTTNDPDQALLYFLPFSVVNLVQYLYVPNSHEVNAIGRAITDYINVISKKHPFWDRSLGADHFMLSCHDWVSFRN
ncbi:hypothetical protein IC575_020956 [Cucumis melo]